MLIRIIIIALAFLLITAPARAQQTATVNQRISTQIGTLVIENASLASQIEQMQTQLAAALARVKDLEARAPKDDAPKN